MTVAFALSVVSSGAGSGFYGGLIVGDPPAKASIGGHSGREAVLPGHNIEAGFHLSVR